MLKGACQEALGLDALLLTIAPEAPHHRSLKPRDRSLEAGDAEAAFGLSLHTVVLDELGVDQHDQIAGRLADAEIDDEDAPRHPT